MNPFIGYQMSGPSILTFALIAVWSAFWKIAALWIASKNDQKKWFVGLAVVNTFGILEIVYIFYVTKKQWSDVTGFYKSLRT